MTGPKPVLPAVPLTGQTFLPVTENGGIVGWEEDYGRLPQHVRRLTLVGAVVGAAVFAGLLLLFLSPALEGGLILESAGA